jgi:formylmethanofuran dehydrogenase subunit E
MFFVIELRLDLDTKSFYICAPFIRKGAYKMVSREIIEKARDLHGHICPYLVLGLRMGEIALKMIGIEKASVEESVGEDIVAIVEVNNCMVDGIQIITGCTFGNNSLIYVDLGKNAFTLYRRGDRRGIRIYIDSEKLRSRYFSEEALELFKKVIVDRKGDKDDIEKLEKLWTEIGYRLADIPEEEFSIQEVEIVEDIERAPIFESIRCSKCGELVMATRIIYIDNKPYCFACAGRGSLAVVGRGIVDNFRPPYRLVRK